MIDNTAGADNNKENTLLDHQDQISNIHSELLNQIFSEYNILDIFDLNNLRLVSDKFNKIVDCGKPYPRWGLIAKETHRLLTRNKNEHNKKSNELALINNILLEMTKDEGRCHESLFPSTERIWELIGEQQECRAALATLLFEKYDLYQEKNKNKDFNIFKADSKIKSLFGGVKGFEALPILTFNPLRQTGDYIDFITPQEMSAPIMRGVDKHGREFFTIRANGNEGVYCQTFFRRYMHQGSWTQGGHSIISIGCYIIDAGKVNVETFEQLKKLIQTGIVINSRGRQYTLA